MERKKELKEKSVVSCLIREVSIKKLTPACLDVLSMILAEVADPTDKEKKLSYQIHSYNYARQKGFIKNGDVDVDLAHRILKHDIFEDELSKENIMSAGYKFYSEEGYGGWTNFFQKAEYIDEQHCLKLKLSNDFKDMLNEEKKRQGESYFTFLINTLEVESQKLKNEYPSLDIEK